MYLSTRAPPTHPRPRNSHGRRGRVGRRRFDLLREAPSDLHLGVVVGPQVPREVARHRVRRQPGLRRPAAPTRSVDISLNVEWCTFPTTRDVRHAEYRPSKGDADVKRDGHVGVEQAVVQTIFAGWADAPDGGRVAVDGDAHDVTRLVVTEERRCRLRKQFNVTCI